MLGLKEDTKVEVNENDYKDDMSLSVTDIKEKKKPRKKKQKERKGRKCEIRAGPICYKCKVNFEDVDIERIHMDECACYWCLLCANEQSKPSSKSSLKLKRNSPDSVAFKNETKEETINEFINALSKSSDDEKESIMNYMDRQDFDFVYFTWLKYSKVTALKISKDLEFGENMRKSFSKVYRNLVTVNTFLSNENITLIEKIWGATLNYSHRNTTIDLVILRLMEFALSKLNDKNEDNELFTSKQIQELMTLWTDRKILNEKDSVLKNLYHKISLIIFNKI
jgi:hypothetical protein